MIAEVKQAVTCADGSRAFVGDYVSCHLIYGPGCDSPCVFQGIIKEFPDDDSFVIALDSGELFCILPNQVDHVDLLLREEEVGKVNKPDMVSHPPHYQSETGLEVIDVIKAFTADLVGIQATDTGNILKYMCRWKHKNGIEDLKKAKWYLNHLIEQIEKGE